MICHQHKCIFIHIPATAGTSIEEWIIGNDWWTVSPQTKHLLASQARREYAEYWDDYFKFSIIREPVARIKSCLRFPEISFLKVNKSGEIDLEPYLSRYARNGIVLEYAWQFFERHEVARPDHKTGSLYGNLLDEELDYIGYFENLGDVTGHLQERLKIKTPFAHHAQASPDELSRYRVPDASRDAIQKLFWRDYAQYDFGLHVPKPETSAGSVSVSLLSDKDQTIADLNDRIAGLLCYKDGYRLSIDELNEKNKVIDMLTETVENLIVDRDAYKSAMEKRMAEDAKSRKN